MLESTKSLKEASLLRQKVGECGVKLSKLCGLLEKSESFPDLEDFLLL
jgi:hypothetical protein